MSKKHLQVPYGKAVYGEKEIEAVVQVLRTSTQMGAHVRKMEQQTAELFAKRCGVMVNSGSSANYLAVEIADLPKGSEVITPVLTFSTTVAPLVKNGLIPVFVDVEPSTFNVDAEQVEQMITKNTTALMIPNLLGNLPDWKRLRELADKYNLFVIEDSADTLGALFEGRPAGRYSDISTTSFYGSHIINCAGNGGMLCVNQERLANRAKLLRSWGRSSSLFVESEAIEHRFNVHVDDIEYDAKFVFEAIGYNLEPSEIGAAFGLVQLESLERNIDVREKTFREHTDFFRKYEEWLILPQQRPKTRTGWLAFPLIVREDAPFTRREVQIFLEKRGIQTRTVFTGNILRQPGFAKIDCRRNSQGYPNADRVMKGGFLVGCHHGLTEEMVEHIHTSFEEFVNQVVVTV